MPYLPAAFLQQHLHQFQCGMAFATQMRYKLQPFLGPSPQYNDRIMSSLLSLTCKSKTQPGVIALPTYHYGRTGQHVKAEEGAAAHPGMTRGTHPASGAEAAARRRCAGAW